MSTPQSSTPIDSTAPGETPVPPAVAGPADTDENQVAAPAVTGPAAPLVDDDEEFDFPPIVITEGMPREVQKLVVKHPQLHKLFAGKSPKGPGLDPKGVAYPSTPEGWDRAVVQNLIAKGIYDEDVLASALNQRPDNHANLQGPDYICKIVHELWLKLSPTVTLTKLLTSGSRIGSGKTAYGTDLVVNAFRHYDATPPRWEMDVEGKTLVLVTDELTDARKFELAFIGQITRRPIIPRAAPRQANWEWEAIVDGWLQYVKRIELAEDEKEDTALARAIRETIEHMSLGDSIENLRRGKGLSHNGRLLFQGRGIFEALRSKFQNAESADVGRHLRKMGYRSGKRRVGGELIDAYSVPLPESLKTIQKAVPPEPPVPALRAIGPDGRPVDRTQKHAEGT